MVNIKYPEKTVDDLYNIYLNSKKVEDPQLDKPEPEPEPEPVLEVDENSDIRFYLNLVNTILVNIGKEEIHDLRDFKGIDRPDIIKPENDVAMRNMEDELYYSYFENKKNTKS